MAFPVVASTSVGTANGGLSVTKPSGLAVGDLMIIFGTASGYSNSNASISPPSGSWTVIKNRNVSANLVFGSYWKIADASDVAASSFSIGFGDRVAGMMYRITGADPVTTVAFLGETTPSSGTTLGAPSITPTVQSLLLMLAFGSKNNNGAAFTLSAQAIVTSNPSWNLDNSARALDTGNDSKVDGSSATWTASPNTATGAASATYAATTLGNYLQLISINGQIQRPVLFTSTFSFFSIVVQKTIIILSLITAAFTTLTPAQAGELVNKWFNDAKIALANVTNDIKH